MSLKLTELQQIAQAEGGNLIYVVKDGISYAIRKEDFQSELSSRVENLEENQVTGVEVYQTIADLPSTGTALVSYKVANDPTSSNNGYYSWVGSAYVKDADLANGVVESGNVDAVSGGAVYENTKPLYVDVQTLEDVNNLQNANLPIRVFNYDNLTSTQNTSQNVEDGIVHIINAYDGSIKLTPKYDVVETNNRTLEVFFTPENIGSSGFGIQINRNGTDYNLNYRSGGQLLESVDESYTSGLVYRNTNAAYSYSNGDLVSIKININDGLTTIQTSVNGVYSPDIYNGDTLLLNGVGYCFRGLGEVKDVYFKSYIEDSEILDTIFVNDADGLDTNNGKFPFTQPSGNGRNPKNGSLKTITEALKRGVKNIIIVEGDYNNETDLTIVNDVNISTYHGGVVNIDLSEKHLGSTFSVNNTYSNVYEKAIATTVTTAFEDDYLQWFELVGSLVDCSTTEGSCYYSGGTLYINPVNADINAITVIIPSVQGFNIPTPLIDGLSETNRTTLNVRLNGLTVLYSNSHGFDIKNINYDFNRCNSFGSSNNGFYFEDSFGVLKGCESSYNDGDGFNVHGFNNMKEGYSDFIDCKAVSNYGTGAGNDGISFHEKTKGRIFGGVYKGNTKFDIIHVGESQVQHYNIECDSFGYNPNGSDELDLHMVNVNCSGNIKFDITNLTVNILIDNCYATELDFYGNGTAVLNGIIKKSKANYLKIRIDGAVDVLDNKIKEGTGIIINRGTFYFDGNSILYNSIGIRKDSGIATMGTNNLYNNNSNYTGSDPVIPTEQAKNVSYLEV